MASQQPPPSSPLLYELQEIVNATRLLYQTNEYLRGELQACKNVDEQNELNAIITENEVAIQVKQEKADEIRIMLGMPPIAVPPGNGKSRDHRSSNQTAATITVSTTTLPDGAVML